MKKYFLLILTLIFVCSIFAQTTGYIKGFITDSTGRGLAGTHVDILYTSGAVTGRGAVTDRDGRYTIDNLHAGAYDLMYSRPHNVSMIINGVMVGADESTGLNIIMRTASGKEYEVVSYERPLINNQDTRLDQRVSQQDIKNLDINDLAAQQAGVSQRDAGSPITIEGSHEYEVLYMYNGIPLMNRPASGHGLP